MKRDYDDLYPDPVGHEPTRCDRCHDVVCWDDTRYIAVFDERYCNDCIRELEEDKLL